ncbi:MAG: GNAT family N-acetyltransferase [Alphaproteobacteria bacterium]|nr:GNAT family N-acetyltransferase [Alphaproteobacteria bacterium]
MTKTPFNITIETPNYVVRTLEDTDEMGNWGSWVADENTARMLNFAPKTLTLDDFKEYVRAFDRVDNHVLGIFRRQGGELIGMFAMYVDWTRLEFQMNLLIGDIPERKTHVRHETSYRVNRYFFEDLDLRSQFASTLSTNIPAIRALEEKNWTLCGRSAKAAADGKGNVEILHYTRSREVWRAGTPMSDAELVRRDSAA